MQQKDEARSSGTAQGTPCCGAAHPLCPATNATAAPRGRTHTLCPDLTQGLGMSENPELCHPDPLQTGVREEPKEAVFSGYGCSAWVGQQVEVWSSCSQGHNYVKTALKWLHWCNASNYMVLSGGQQAELHHRTHPTTQKMGSGCLRRKPGSSWGAAMGFEDRAGGSEKLPVQQLFPLTSWPSHPPLLPSAATAWLSVARAEGCVFLQPRRRTRKPAGNKLLPEGQLAGRSQTASGSKSS